MDNRAKIEAKSLIRCEEEMKKKFNDFHLINLVNVLQDRHNQLKSVK